MSTSDDTEFKARLEEYRELRAEIRGYISGESSYRNLALVVTGAVLGAVRLQPKLAILYLFSACTTAAFWFLTNDKLRAIFAISAYIEVFIEPITPGLGWETRVNACVTRNRSGWRALLCRADLIVLYILNIGLFFGSNTSVASWLIVLLLQITAWLLGLTYSLPYTRQHMLMIWRGAVIDHPPTMAGRVYQPRASRHFGTLQPIDRD